MSVPNNNCTVLARLLEVCSLQTMQDISPICKCDMCVSSLTCKTNIQCIYALPTEAVLGFRLKPRSHVTWQSHGLQPSLHTG